ncbi:hypothetical protein [Brevibacillus centrosporus]|uniref:hypothetical protein n=1 Tax=Brevibacillus centrosporus TaxID=54910 RepID=UPI003B028257
MGLALLGTTLIAFILFVLFIVTRSQFDEQQTMKTHKENVRHTEMHKTIFNLKLGLGVAIIAVSVTVGLSIFGSGEKVNDHSHGLRQPMESETQR